MADRIIDSNSTAYARIEAGCRPSFPRASLLGLPLELRDMIYSHLSRTEVTSWQTKLDVPQTLFGDAHYTAVVTITNMPILNVHRVNAQVNTEYSQATSFRGLTGTVDGNVEVKGFGLELAANTRAGELQARVRQATIFVDNGLEVFGEDSTPFVTAPWKDISLLIKEFVSHMSKLDTLRLALHQRGHLAGNIFSYAALLNLNGDVLHPGNNAARLLPDRLGRMGDLALAQEAEGYRHCYVCRFSTVSPYAGPHVMPGRKWITYHSTARAEVYLYSKGTISKQYWTKEETIDHFPLVENDDHVMRCEP